MEIWAGNRCHWARVPKSCPAPGLRTRGYRCNGTSHWPADRLGTRLGATCGCGEDPSPPEITFPASWKGTGTRNGIKWEAPIPGSAQFSVPLGPRRLGQRPGAPGPGGECVHCGTRQGVRPAGTRVSSRAPPTGTAEQGVAGCGELGCTEHSHSKPREKGFLLLLPGLYFFFFFLLTVWYVLVCYFVHPCDCHFINSCAFCIFHMIKIVSRVITIYTVVLVTLRTYLHITGH